MTIGDIIKLYKGKLDHLDTELILAYSLKKTREFILTHPEKTVTFKQQPVINKNIKRRMRHEPISYITGHKEFYGLDFIVNKNTLVPRPETELLVELALDESKVKGQGPKVRIVDIGTGSGNIIISIVKALESTKQKLQTMNYLGIDISKEALKIAKKNAKIHGVDKKIKFLHGNLLYPLLKTNKLTKLIRQPADYKLIIVANLPYLSKEIYSSAPNDVKKYEPKSALYSANNGLSHYNRLLEQLKKIHDTYYLIHTTCILEFSPEQKQPLTKLIRDILPNAKTFFIKDLSGRWRICKINL